jgi:hypothetical protein
MSDTARTHLLALGSLASPSRSCFLLCGFGLVALVSLPAALAAQNGTAFDPGCPYPFADIAVKHPIDSDCGVQGKSGGTPENAAQNQAKNNFCATGNPSRVTAVSFAKLQKAVVKAQIPFGDASHLPPDRSKLHDIYTTSDGNTIGEGSVVRLVAFVDNAHPSDVSSGESVNCGEKGEEQNDIHIPTVKTPDADECTSVTAEMTPHGRPAGWTSDALNQLGVPVRITGQLFFDGSHRPCKNGKGSPKRVSLWEIHPVYAVDVCSGSTLAECPYNDETKWHPLVAKPTDAAAPPGK